jgi:CheY-like chemotaxis protein
VICLDVDLRGELDGWQVMVRLKTNQATAHVPVIVCGGEQGRSTAATLGAADFLAKPFSPDQLRVAVAQQLSDERSKILIVGDEMLRRLVAETLARDGGELREAADGLEALAMITARQPDVLVLDLPTPALHGFREVKDLLEHPETRGLPVIVLTNHNLSDSEKLYLRARSVSLIQKSEYSGDQLRRLIHHTPPTPLATAALPPESHPPLGDTETRQHAD